MIEHPMPVGPNPFEEPASTENEIPKMPVPMPMSKEGESAGEDGPEAIPGPPMEKEAAYRRGNPYMQVAQTQEWGVSGTVPASHVPQVREYPEMENAPNFTEEQLHGSKTYSKAWSDALGLPAQGK
ncbi:MAG: hypothetical protein KDA84_17350 [Planctomycetaceae bacterium]|nr:hypothetical protein [Planctomycetaceae bacterium]